MLPDANYTSTFNHNYHNIPFYASAYEWYLDYDCKQRVLRFKTYFSASDYGFSMRSYASKINGDHCEICLKTIEESVEQSSGLKKSYWNNTQKKL